MFYKSCSERSGQAVLVAARANHHSKLWISTTHFFPYFPIVGWVIWEAVSERESLVGRMFIKCVLGVNTCGRDGKGRKQEWTEGEVDLRSSLRDSSGQPHREVWWKWPTKVVLCWAQMVRPLYPCLSRVWASVAEVVREGPIAVTAVGATRPFTDGAVLGRAPGPPHTLTVEKRFLCVGPVLGHVRIWYITQFSQHSEVLVACYILHMRKLGLCLFFLMKTQHGAMFHRWPTTWSSLSVR